MKKDVPSRSGLETLVKYTHRKKKAEDPANPAYQEHNPHYAAITAIVVIAVITLGVLAFVAKDTSAGRAYIVPERISPTSDEVTVSPDYGDDTSVQSVLDVLNSCRYYGGPSLEEGQSCNDICADPSLWHHPTDPAGTCIMAEFTYKDPSAYAGEIVRCSFSQEGRYVKCVCCTP